MTINNEYNIGERVKAYNNEITLEGISNKLELMSGIIRKIIIERDIVTKEYIYLYELDNGEVYSEGNLMRVLF